MSFITVLISFTAAIMGGLLSGYFSTITNERKLSYENARSNKEFYRDKYEQLTLKLIQLNSTLIEEKHLKISKKESATSLSEIAQLAAEIEMLVKLYFPNLKVSFENFSRMVTNLYTQIIHDDESEMINSFEKYSRKATYLIEVISDNENVYEYTKKLPFEN